MLKARDDEIVVRYYLFISRHGQIQDQFVTDEDQIAVFLFGSLTSTGIHNSVLVLYMDLLVTSQKYILYLDTHNTLTNTTGNARQLIEFSPPPVLVSITSSCCVSKGGTESFKNQLYTII